MPKTRVQVFFDETDMQYIYSVRKVAGFESNSETVRFLVKLLRLILPKAPYVAYIISELMREEEKTKNNRRK